MEKTKKFIRSFIIFILLILMTFYILFKDQDIESILNILSTVKKEYIILAIVGICGYILCEALNTKRNLKALNENVKIKQCIKYSLVNAFFSGITPSSTGGQPMEIYYMHKDGIKVSNATLTVLIQSCAFQIITLSYAIISIFFNIAYMNTALITLFIIGFVLNAGILIVYLVAIFSKKISNFAISIFIKILKKFKVKNIEQREERIKNGLESYQSSAKYIKENKKVVLKTLLTSIFQIFFLYNITYWVYCALGINTYNILKIVSIQAIIYTSTSGIPLPGAVGISEGNFITIFKNIFAENIVTSAMLLSRGISFYVLIVVSGIYIGINQLINSREN